MKPDDIDLVAVAGVSLRAPQTEYRLADLPFGEAALVRAHGATSSLSSLKLSLTAEAAERCMRAGDSDVRAVSLTLTSWHGSPYHGDNSRMASLRGLVVDHALLGHPEALRAHALKGVERQSPEGEALLLLGAYYDELAAGKREAGRECVECRNHRQAAEQRREAEQKAELQRQLSAAKTRYEVAAIQQEFYRRSGGYSYGYYGAPRRERDCAHIAMVALAMKGFCERLPEVVFELIGLFTPVGGATGRFVLADVMTRVVVPMWLVGRGRPRYDDWSPYRRRTSAAYGRWTGIRDRARAAKELPAVQREGVSFAATAWGYTDALSTLGWVPSEATGDEEAQPALRDEDGDERLEVERVLPSFATRKAAAAVVSDATPVAKPKASVAKKVAAKVKTTGAKPKVTAKVKTASAKPKVTAKPTTITDLSDAEKVAMLRSLGIPDDVIKLTVGTLRDARASKKRR